MSLKTVMDSRREASFIEHLNRVSAHFTEEQLPMLKELITKNPIYPDYPKDYDLKLFERYKLHSELLSELSSMEKPAVGHLVNVTCKNGRQYSEALITRIDHDGIMICVHGGGFIHRDNLLTYGLSMTVCGGYFMKAPSSNLQLHDNSNANYQFSGTGRVEACCGISIERPMKRWSLDDSNGDLGFY